MMDMTHCCSVKQSTSSHEDEGPELIDLLQAAIDKASIAGIEGEPKPCLWGLQVLVVICFDMIHMWLLYPNMMRRKA